VRTSKIAIGLTTLSAAALLLGGTACENKEGGGTETKGTPTPTAEQQASDAVLAYFHAQADKDSQKACDQLTAAAKTELQQNLRLIATGDCKTTFDKFIAQLKPEQIEKLRAVKVTGSKIDSNRATVTFEGGTQPVPLILLDGQWKISSFR
jgi:hypothetical protein